MADKFVSQVDIGVQRNLDDSLKQLSGGITIKTPAMPEALKDRMIAAIAENVSLIKSIPTQFHQRIESAKTLLDKIRHTGSVTEIAVCQIRAR